MFTRLLKTTPFVLLAKAIDSIWEGFGRPVSLIRLLANHPEIVLHLESKETCIAAASVTQWHALGEDHSSHHPRGTLMGWKMHGKDYYGSYTLHRPEYDEIGLRECIENWSCDISEVHGFSASKSDLHSFKSTDDMVETNSRAMIDAITQEKLSENLAHREIRIIHHPGSDYFASHAWDGRLFLINGGGSHHFAAAKYIASRLAVQVPLKGKLHTYSLNALAIQKLRLDYEMFVISDMTNIWLSFHDAMEKFQASWLWHCLPRPLDQGRAILLPKNETRSMRVADLLRRAGVVDLGAHLEDLANS